METARLYKTKDVEMLLASAAIIDSAIANKDFLQQKRATWEDPFFSNIRKRINDAIRDFLGLDGAKALRLSSQVVYGIQKNALNALAEAKVQISEDFKSNIPLRNEILTQLGYPSFHKPAQNGDQEALINLLYQFRNSLTPQLKDEITAKGTAATTLDAITDFADVLTEANITQEYNKGVKKVMTAQAITEFNAIYSEVVSICKIAANFYKGNPPMQDQFRFAAVAKKLNAQPIPPKPKTP